MNQSASSSGELSIKDQNKKQSEQLTVFVIVFLSLIYSFFFLPEPVLNVLKMKFGEISKVGNIGSILAGMGFSGMIAYLIGKVIMAQDILATTDLKPAKFFRAQYPSKAIKKKYGCGQAQADYLWFSLFNPWKDKDHHCYQSYLFTFQRDYSCRFILYTQRAFFIFTILSIITWCVACAVFRFLGIELEPAPKLEQVYSRILLLFVAGVVLLVLTHNNRVGEVPPDDKLGEVVEDEKFKGKGCWARFVEINNIDKQWLEIAVFKNANDYDKAVALLQDVTWRKTWGYKPL